MLHLVSTVVLARLLTPSDFGNLVVVFFVFALAQSFSTQLLIAPLVQRPSISPAHLATGVTLALTLGAALSLATALIGAELAEPLFGGEVADLLPIAAAGFLLSGAAAVPQAVLQRRLDFRRLNVIMLAGTLCTVALSIGLAADGVGAASVVLGSLAGTALTAALTAWVARPPPPRWHRREAGDLLRFGLPALGSGVAKVGRSNIDYAVLAARIDAAALGIYWRAFQLGVLSERKLTRVPVSLALPLYSRTASIDSKRALRGRILRAQAIVRFPLLGGLILVAPVFIPLLLGGQWEAAVVPTQILAVAGMAQVVFAGTEPLVLGVGHPGALLRWNISNMVGLGVITFVAAPWGLVPLACTVAAFHLIRLVVGQRVLLGRLAGVSLTQVARDCMPAAVGTVVLLALGWLLLATAATVGASEELGVAAVVVAGPIIYFAVLRLVFPASLGELRWNIRRLLGGRLRWRWAARRASISNQPREAP